MANRKSDKVGGEFMKRAGIYFFFDKDGIVDQYVPFFISELHKVVDYIVVVINGKLTATGREVLVESADDLCVRENRGFDAWAYKEAIEYIGWEDLHKFDELVLANCTTFGPLFPFQETFEKMEADPCDFWGMYCCFGDKKKKDWFGIPLPKGIPAHIASNFLVFKRNILHSYEFHYFWESLPQVRNYFESNAHFEFPLTDNFAEKGFSWATVDNGLFQNTCPNIMVYGALQAISELKIPIFRKKAFFDPNGSIDFCTDIPREVMRYIANNTQYDCNLIWENLLRTVNLYDLKNWFNWNQILPVDYFRPIKKDPKIAVIFYTYYDDIAKKYRHNIEAFPDGTDFYFTTDTKEKRENLQKLFSPFGERYHIEYRLVENRGRDVSALLVGCRDIVLEGSYDLICFMHDREEIENSDQFSCVEQSFSNCCIENIADSSNYINNVIAVFEDQPRLGIAVPPPPKNASYYKTIGGSWGMSNNFQNVQKLLLELGITVPIEQQKPPVTAYGSVFWFRPDALFPLFQRKWCVEDFPLKPICKDNAISNTIELSYGFIAQKQGYYTSVIMNSAYAEQEVTRMTEIAHTYIDFTLQQIGQKAMLKMATSQFSQMLRQRKENSPVSTPAKTTNKPPLLFQKTKKSPIHKFFRGICPIGLWNLLRRIRCAVAGGSYIEPTIKRGPIKTVIRACMPRFLWNLLRKAKCKENGWVFVED